MAITVKHSGSIGQLGYLAHEGGKAEGKRRRFNEDRQYLLQRQQVLNQQKRFDAELDYRKEAAQANRALQLELQGNANDYRMEQLSIAHELGQQDAEFRAALEQKNVDYRFSAKQKAEFDALAQSLREIENSPDFRPDEKLAIRKQIMGKMMGFQPQPTLAEKSPYPEGQGIGDVWEYVGADGKATGIIVTRDEKGNPKKIGETGTTNKDRIDAWRAASEALTTYDGENNAVFPSLDKVEELARRMLGLKDGESVRPEELAEEVEAAFHEGETQAEAPAERNATQPGTQPVIAGFPPDLWRKMDDEDQRAVWEKFRRGIPLREIIKVVREVL